MLKEWHPVKNAGINPMSSKLKDKVWWCLPYDDPETGKHFNFEWKATIGSRVRGKGCPYLSGHAVWQGFNDLATKRPDLASQWHPTKNGGLTPETVTYASNKKVWWYLPYDDPKTGKHFEFVWEAMISNRLQGNDCPYISGKATWPGYNDLATKRPDLVSQWHPTKNGESSPEMVTCHSEKMVWWYLPYDDPETGKHFNFEWQAYIADRVNCSGCPFLSGQAVWPGYNDLATKRPDLAAQWHSSKNGVLTPEMVTCNSNKKVWWHLPYDDPETGKRFEFAWQSTIANRLQGNGCPYLSGQGVWPGYNDLATKRPDLASQWHPTKNGLLTSEMVMCYSHKKVWWHLPYDDPETGKHFNFEWQACIADRVNCSSCPFLSGQAVWPGYNDLATKRPDLASQWHPRKNGVLTPEMETCLSNKKVWWYLPYDDPETGKHFNFEWRASIGSRAQGCGCPFLVGKAVWTGYNDLESNFNIIAHEWEKEKNYKKTSDQIYIKETHVRRWWKCSKCKCEWRATVYARTVRGVSCPNCRRNKNYYA